MAVPGAPGDGLLLDARFLRTLESLALVARRLASSSERGERSSPRAGSGVAFAGHRPYSAGDDVRFLDWQVLARSERLYVKQYEEERDLSVHLLLDCSGSMAHGDGRAFHYARQLCAALGYIALSNLDRVSVQPYASSALPALRPLRGRSRALVLLRYLAALRAEGTTDLRAAARAVCTRASRGGLAVVLSDGLDAEGLLAGVDVLRYGQLSPIVLLVSDPRAAFPALRGELTLVDRESGEERTLWVSERLLMRYREHYLARAAELERALRQRHVRTLALSIDLPLERAVLEVLRRGGVVG